MHEKEYNHSVVRHSLSVLIEPTSGCNLECEYCYKGKKIDRRMSFSTFQVVAQKLINYCRKENRPLLWVWHGGEPTLLGVDFYRHAFQYCSELNKEHRSSHILQTNGTLLVDSLLDLFVKYTVSIGVSLDGPEQYHDQMRPMRNGEGTYASVIDGIMRAKEKGIDVGILMSITKKNAGFIKEMFQFCRKNRFTFGLNPISADLHSPHADIEISPDEYLSACKEAYDLWFYQQEYSIQVNPGFGVTRLLLSKTRLSECSLSENCQEHFISIGPEGDIYPCNRFYGLSEFKFGNIRYDSVEDILNGEKRCYMLKRRFSTIEKCRECEIGNYCNGGCMHHALVHNGNLYSPDHLCKVYKGLVEHALIRLNEALN